MAKDSKDTEQIRVNSQFARRARSIASLRGMTLADWLDDRFREILEAELPYVASEFGLPPPNPKAEPPKKSKG